MADTDGTVTSQNPGLNGSGGPQAGMISQYIKDLSVENPNAPDSYQWPGQLNFDVQFRAESRQLNDEVHEMLCTYTIAAKCEQGTAYLVELAYGALVGLRGLDEEQTRRFLFAETPRLVFPTIRLILGNAIRDAGFPPLVLEPIDFNALYEQQAQDPNFGAPVPPAEGNA
ncbi:protein-export chaperone SecB [Blastomonas sp.]|uniref:protein-export chaperone SecB n=1 Tax=Blastomonas sp. TaxID=1909299 RepID=UPI0035948CE6